MSDRHEHGDLFDPPIHRAGGQITRNPVGGAREALKVHSEKNRHTIATVRAMALALYYLLGRPISVNDIREDWDAIGPLSADPRAIGAVFASNDWRKVGRVDTNAPGSNKGRTVATFVPSSVPLDDPRDGPLAQAFEAGWRARHEWENDRARPVVKDPYADALNTYLREIK